MLAQIASLPVEIFYVIKDTKVYRWLMYDGAFFVKKTAKGDLGLLSILHKILNVYFLLC